MEKYWEDEEMRGEIKETWARLRCGSIGRDLRTINVDCVK